MEAMKLRPFDLEAAKKGEPVITREGYPAKIYDFNFKNGAASISGKIIRDDDEILAAWAETGEEVKGIINDWDLFMAPVKKEGWVNIYSDSYYVGNIYKTKEEALDMITESVCIYRDTIKIEWEE